MKLGFGQIEAALRERHSVHDDWHSAFRARLRYLQRADYGIPRAGVGRKANFGVGHALLLDLGLELENFGLEPTDVADLINDDRKELADAVWSVCAEPRTRKGRDEDRLLFIYPSALTFLMLPKGDKPEARRAYPILKHGLVSELTALFLADPHNALIRAAFLNLSFIVSELIEALAGEGADPEPFYSDLADWAVSEGAQQAYYGNR